MSAKQTLAQLWEERLGKNFNLRGSGHRRFSERYNAALYRSKERAIEEALRRADILLRGQDLLDAGCGTGFFEEYARRRNVRSLHGIDITRVSVETLRQRYADFTFTQTSLADYAPQPGVSFDGIAAIDVLYCLVANAEFESAFANLAHHVRPGGWLLVSDRFFHTGKPQEHVHFRSWTTYEELAKKNGLTPVLRLPLFVLLARTFVPVFGPLLLDPLGPARAWADGWLRDRGDWVVRHAGGLNLALFRKASNG